MVVWPLRPVRRRPQPAPAGRRHRPRCQARVDALEDRICLSVSSQFTPATDYLLGSAAEGMETSAPASVAAGDLTGTGRTDLVAVIPTSPQVTVLQNNGDGTFTPLAPVPLSSADEEVVPQPDAVVVADVNGDGLRDLVVADYANDALIVLLNTTPKGATSPTFAAPQFLPLDLPPTALVAGNFVDGDPRPDFVATEPLLGEVAVLLNQTVPGSSTVAFSANFYSLSEPVAVAVGPFTGSSHQDIAVGEGSSGTVDVLPGNGDGTFGAPLVGTVPGSVEAVAPFSDPATGLQGFVAAGDGTVYLFGQTSTGPLTPLASFPLGSDLHAIATADVNGDGVTDIVATDAETSSADTATGPFTGSRGLPPEQTYAVGNEPSAVVAADLNGDGAPDLAIANTYSRSVSVLLNLGGTRTTLASTPGGPQAYQPITFTATVTSALSGQVVAGGTVTFMDGSGTALGSAPVVNGVATFTDQAGLPAGVFQFTAMYAGDQQGVPALFPSRATETVVVSQTVATPTPTGPVPTHTRKPPKRTPPDIPVSLVPTSKGGNGSGTDSEGGGAGPGLGATTVVLPASLVGLSRTPLDGGGGPASDPRVPGPGFLAAWSNAEAPLQSEFGPALDSVAVASATAVVSPPGEKAQGPPRPGLRGAGAAVQDLALQQALPADKALLLVASSFDGDDSVTLFEAVARGWVKPPPPVLSTAPATDTPAAPASADTAAVNAVPAAAVRPPASGDGAAPGDPVVADPAPPRRVPAFVAAALAVAGLWFRLTLFRPAPARGAERRPVPE
jgi:hypothetical protein